MENNSFEMLKIVARRNVQAAWLRVASAIIIVMAGMTWFWMTLAPMVNLVGFAVAIIVAYLIVASQVKNLSRARARARTLPVLLLLLVGGAGAADAQELNFADCPQLRTIEMSRQQIESLRAQREAGIDRLPTAQHQRLALESLYRWYWPRIARLDQQQREIEAYCYRTAQVRSDYGATRMSPLPEYQDPRAQYQYQNPYANDPFSRTDPRYAPPMYPYQGGWTYSPYANQTRVYAPYRSRRGGIYDPGALPSGNYDPFTPYWPR
jgi:hypothetical protein